MASILQDTAFGYILFLASGKRWLRHPEQLPGYTVPSTFKTVGQIEAEKREAAREVNSEDTAVDPVAVNAAAAHGGEKPGTSPHGGSETPVKAAAAGEAEKGGHIQAEQDTIVVDWYSADDPANPHNWTDGHKVANLGVLLWLTFVVYMGASVISPGIPYLVEQYQVSEVVGTLTIGLYVLGYGLGPLLFSPLSEIPAIGRLPMYVAPLFLFFCVNFATIWTPTFGGLLASRFLTGFLASPALGTGGATCMDVLSPINAPFGLMVWVLAAYQGPGLGPVIVTLLLLPMSLRLILRRSASQFSILEHGGGHWAFILVLLCVIFTFMFMQETSADNILLRRAVRIRQVTGNDRYRSMGEIRQQHLTAKSVYYQAIIKPFEIAIKDPSVAYTHIYLSLLYAFYYLFFASFPIIFFEEYGFGIGTGELPYLNFTVGGCVFAGAYAALYGFVVKPNLQKGIFGEPEDMLFPALPASILSAASLFCAGWTAGRTNFMAPIIFAAVYAGSTFCIFQPLFGYLSVAYPAYAASLFAANDALRSTLAFCFLIAGPPLFHNLGVGAGSSVVGALCAACIPGIFILKWKGKALRARSTFAVHY